jgi:hypothetical protein
VEVASALYRQRVTEQPQDDVMVLSERMLSILGKRQRSSVIEDDNKVSKESTRFANEKELREQEEMVEEIGELRSKVLWSPCFPYDQDSMKCLVTNGRLSHKSHLFSSLPFRNLELKEHTHSSTRMVQLHNFALSLRSLVEQGSNRQVMTQFFANGN